MRCSARSTSRRARGFTLLEVMVAATLFAIVMGVALSQIIESSDAARVTTVQADLRRVGENILSQLVPQLRSTQARFTSGTSNTLEFYRVTGFDESTGEPTLEGAGAPATNSTILYRYAQSGTSLQFKRGPRNTINSATTIEMTRELDTTDGFKVVGMEDPLPGLISSNSNNVFGDKPVRLSIELKLTRRISKKLSATDTSRELMTVRLSTQVQLKPSKAY